MRVETEYKKKEKIKERQRAAFRRFIRGQSTPINIREYIGLNYLEVKALLESRMLPSMMWNNYANHWVVDHVVPFWIFDLSDEKELKLLWHPENLMPMLWKDNNYKQGDLRFALLLLTRRKGYSLARERLIERCETGIKVQEKYLAFN
jgi:hypothetical protein